VSRYLRLALFVMGVGSFLFLIVLFVLPTRWEVARAQNVRASAEQIYAHLDDLHAWKAWSPWQESAYPGLVFRYAGPARGPGAQLSWQSESTGDGLLRIEASDPPRLLAFSMSFQKGRIRARDTLRLESLPGGATRVTWHDQGTLGRTLIGRLSLPLVEQSMGRDLERGLAALAAVAEGRPVPTPTPAASAPAR